MAWPDLERLLAPLAVGLNQFAKAFVDGSDIFAKPLAIAFAVAHRPHREVYGCGDHREEREQQVKASSGQLCLGIVE